MRIFSNRRRSVSAGPYLSERLPRRQAGAAVAFLGTGRERQTSRPGNSFTNVIDPVVEVFAANRTAQRSRATAPMPSPEAEIENLKGYCHFLDADLVGVCELPSDVWQGEAIDGHIRGVAILVETGRSIKAGEPGHDWIAVGENAAADLRAMEVATVVARYLGTLGHGATAHSIAACDVDMERVSVEAGVLEVRRGRLRHPFIYGDYGLAVITTTCPLLSDRALAPRNPLRYLHLRLAHALGRGGTRPGLRRLNGQRRPWHLGAYPMEKIRRVDEPTTLIIPEEVKRPAARHNFFVRARAGDLGERPKHEVGRFIQKAPHGMASQQMLAELVPLQHGEAAPEVAAGTSDPKANALDVKALGHFLGADMVGVCAAPEYAWYSHRADGTPIEAVHENAIVFVLDQGYETMEGASGDDWISGAQSMRAYLRASIISNILAAHLRSLGWAAQAHTAAYDEVSHIPLLLNAGIGELSRIGELVLNPFVGPRFKSGVVTTDFPLDPDRPIDFGLQDFCTKCTKCARECPCGAIRFGGKTMFNGYEMWKPDVDRCARYRITNMRGSACGRCMKTCPYNVEGVMAERPFQWAAIRLPFARGWIAKLDDRVGRGSINPAKKWWVDIEMIDEVPVEPPKGANERGLNLERGARDEAGYAMFPPDLAPPGAEGMKPFPLIRKAGVAAAGQAESPVVARARTAGGSSENPEERMHNR